MEKKRLVKYVMKLPKRVPKKYKGTVIEGLIKIANFLPWESVLTTYGEEKT